MFYNFTENYVRIAVDRVGGPTKVSTMLGIATGTVHEWIKKRRICNIDYATKVAKAAGLEVHQLRATR